MQQCGAVIERLERDRREAGENGVELLIGHETRTTRGAGCGSTALRGGPWSSVTTVRARRSRGRSGHGGVSRAVAEAGDPSPAQRRRSGRPTASLRAHAARPRVRAGGGASVQGGADRRLLPSRDRSGGGACRCRGGDERGGRADLRLSGPRPRAGARDGAGGGDGGALRTRRRLRAWARWLDAPAGRRARVPRGWGIVGGHLPVATG